MPGQFAIKNAKYVLLTYAQTGPSFDPESILLKCSEYSAECLISRERHADGGIHYHAFVDFGGKPFSSRNTNVFDCNGHHPNIERVGKTPWLAYDYVIKDGDIILGGATRPEGESTNSSHERGQTKSRESWAYIIGADNRTEFFERLHTYEPRALACSFTSLTKYADWKYRPNPVPYVSPENYIYNLEYYPELGEWVGESILAPESSINVR